jgi:hypothetical protein
MLFNLSHGQHIAREDAPPADVARADLTPMAAVAPNQVRPRRKGQLETVGADASPDRAPAPEPEAPVGKFRYFFPDAAGLPETPEMLARLDALGDSMVEDNPTGPEPATLNATTLPPILTYFGQFIDHDITANTDRESELSFIDGNVTPADRAVVEAGLVNLRDGALELDSLYGDKPDQHPFLLKLAGLMRHPTFTAKMRLGVPSLADGPRPPLPASPDNATDLPRLRFFLNRGDITLQELQDLPDDLRGAFLEPDGAPIGARAIIGDGRNDENLIVAQFHALMLRFHNKLVDATGGGNFEEARKLTRWHYQWLVVNAYLRAICDAAVLDEVIEMEAPLYHGFFDKHGPTHGATGPKMPMALEFSVAAFRFGHSMIRAVYDHNRIFGEAVPGSPSPLIPVAPFNLLFAFTGNGRMRPDPTSPPVTNGPLPVNWVIEWERFLSVDPTRPLRAARKIDTDIAPPLADLVNEANDPALAPQTRALFKHLARRNLRRGYRLNLPTAQSAYGAMRTIGVKPFWMLKPQEIASGSPERQDAVTAGGFHVETPLWFYVLKEAEVLGQGEKLGPLGSHLVANTLLGLIIEDKDSYWNAPGGRWSPDKFNASQPVDSLEEMVHFCGMI